jgi:hypothetical protein
MTLNKYLYSQHWQDPVALGSWKHINVGIRGSSMIFAVIAMPQRLCLMSHERSQQLLFWGAQ